mgnify:CR=1 FL=1
MNTMIKYLFTLLILLQAGALWAQQPAKVAKKFFADPEMDIHTPWFQKGNVCTTYDEMMSYINNLITRHPETASLSFIGKTQKGRNTCRKNCRKDPKCQITSFISRPGTR